MVLQLDARIRQDVLHVEKVEQQRVDILPVREVRLAFVPRENAQQTYIAAVGHRVVGANVLQIEHGGKIREEHWSDADDAERSVGRLRIAQRFNRAQQRRIAVHVAIVHHGIPAPAE